VTVFDMLRTSLDLLAISAELLIEVLVPTCGLDLAIVDVRAIVLRPRLMIGPLRPLRTALWSY